MPVPLPLQALAVRLGARPRPLSLSFEVTHKCNLSCAYCDRNRPRATEMSASQIARVVEELVSLGTRAVCLDGGEPLLHPELDAIVDRLIAGGVRVNMNSNGLLVPRKMTTVTKLSKLKISVDGPQERHDAVRGRGAFCRALRGAIAARDAGVRVELTCVVGAHNVDAIDDTIDIAERVGLPIVFQPERKGLFRDSARELAASAIDIRRAFAKLEARKARSRAVANRWSSLRHFRGFPADTPIPCAAGWINATLDPQGNLHACGQASRKSTAPNVVELGVREAFTRLDRNGCAQCWCARVVEENVAWGGRFDTMLPPLRAGHAGHGLPGTPETIPI